MDTELLAFAAVLGLALLLGVAFASSRLVGVAAALGWLAVVAALLYVAPYYRAYASVPFPVKRPYEATRDDYVSSDACVACHPREYATWRRSYHSTMTQQVTPETVMADFDDGVQLALGGETFDVERKGDRFWVRFYHEGLGETVRREIVLSTGSHHMQLYWFSLGEGRAVGQIPFFYLKREQRFVPRDAAFLKPWDETPPPEHRRWNLECVFCHTTRPRPLYSENSINTQAVEFGISCEACHGPGGPHVRANAENPARRYWLHLTDAEDDTIVQPAHLEKERSVEVCGQCHGATLAPASLQEHAKALLYGYRYQPGDVLEETGRIVLRRETLDEPEVAKAIERFHFDPDTMFWPDGMVRTIRDYNGVTGSACYQRGDMTCLSCHEMHKSADDPRSLDEWADDQLIAGMRGDAACTQCHPQFSEDVAAHTKHAPDSEGSRCQNCHMPYTTWGLLKAVRQHDVDAPRVSASVEAGRPNACNICHLDKTLAWSADHLSRWYGQPVPELTEEQQRVAASVLWMISGEAGQRALAAWHAGWEPAREASGGDWLAPHLAQLFEDPYPGVRIAAWRSLTSMAGFEDVELDFVGPEEERAAAREEAWARYSSRARPANGRAQALLLYPDGSLDRLALQKLLATRDDRDFFLAE